MTASSDDQRVSRNSSNSSTAHPLSNSVTAKDDLIINARVTYAPLAIWKDFHWTCTATSSAPLVPDRLE